MIWIKIRERKYKNSLTGSLPLVMEEFQSQNDGEVLIDIPEELLIKDANDPIEAITKAFWIPRFVAA